ncbi:MAG: hypothetical protein ACRC8A_07340 [Microcoleaceae cyanobacterium]
MTSSEGIEQRFRQIDQELSQLRQGQSNLTVQLERLTLISVNLVEMSRVQQEELRILRLQADQDRVTWQTEIRQIWEYLQRDRPYGSSG